MFGFKRMARVQRKKVKGESIFRHVAPGDAGLSS